MCQIQIIVGSLWGCPHKSADPDKCGFLKYRSLWISKNQINLAAEFENNSGQVSTCICTSNKTHE